MRRSGGTITFYIASTLGGRTECLLAITFSKNGEGKTETVISIKSDANNR